MNATLATRLTPISNTLLRNVLLAVVGSLFVAGAAQVSVPFIPVPLTLQTLAVLLVGGAYGLRLGTATLCLYALEGAIGLPFFAHANGGFAYLLHGATAGYVLGFIVAAAFMGRMAERGAIASPIRMAIAALVASALVYVPGVLWLAQWFANAKGMGAGDAMNAAFTGGFVPFIWGDIMKAVIAGLSLAGGWSLMKR